MPDRSSADQIDDNSAVSNYRQAVDAYIDSQLDRLKKGTTKFNDLLHVKVLLMTCASVEDMQLLVNQLKTITNKHTDTGLKGFFKATWARTPKSRQILDQFFDANNNLINQDQAHASNTTLSRNN